MRLKQNKLKVYVGIEEKSEKTINFHRKTKKKKYMTITNES
jgi:hypothetical protein